MILFLEGFTMIFTEHEIVRKEKANGGKGHIIIEHLLTKNELKEQCGMFAHVTLEPNCSLGYHEHHGNGEAYYITVITEILLKLKLVMLSSVQMEKVMASKTHLLLKI
jgi:hypothetical protein